MITKHIALEAPYTATVFHAQRKAQSHPQGRVVRPPQLQLSDWQVVTEGEATVGLSGGRRIVVQDLSGNDFTVIANPGQWIVLGGKGWMSREPNKHPFCLQPLGQTLGTGHFRDTVHTPFIAQDVGRYIGIPTGADRGFREILTYTDASNVLCDTSLGAFGTNTQVPYAKIDRMESYGIYVVESIQSASQLTLDQARPVYGGATAVRYALCEPRKLYVGPHVFEQQGILVEESTGQYVDYPEDAFDGDHPYLYLVAVVSDASSTTGASLRILRHLEDIGQGVVLAIGMAKPREGCSVWIPAYSMNDEKHLSSPPHKQGFAVDLSTNHALQPPTYQYEVTLERGHPLHQALQTKEAVLWSLAPESSVIGEREDELSFVHEDLFARPVYQRGCVSKLAGDVAPSIDLSANGLQPVSPDAINVDVIHPVKENHGTWINRWGVRLTVAIDYATGDLLFRAEHLSWETPVQSWTQSAIGLGALSVCGFVDTKQNFVIGWLEDVAGTHTLYAMRVAPCGLYVEHAAFSLSTHHVLDFQLCKHGVDRILCAWKNDADNHLYWKSVWLREDGTQTTLLAEEDVSSVPVASFSVASQPVRRHAWVLYATASDMILRSRKESSMIATWDTDEGLWNETAESTLWLSSIDCLQALSLPDESIRFFAFSGVTNAAAHAGRTLFSRKTTEDHWKQSSLCSFSATATLRDLCGDGAWKAAASILDGTHISLVGVSLLSGNMVALHEEAASDALDAAYAIHPETGEGYLTHIFTDFLTTRGLAESPRFAPVFVQDSFGDQFSFQGELQQYPLVSMTIASHQQGDLVSPTLLLAPDVTPASGTLLEAGAGVLRDGDLSTGIVIATQTSIGVQVPKGALTTLVLVDTEKSDGLDRGYSLAQSLQVWTSNDNSTWAQQTILHAIRIQGKTWISFASVSARFAKVHFLQPLQVPIARGHGLQRRPLTVCGVFSVSSASFQAHPSPYRNQSMASTPIVVSSWEELCSAVGQCMRRMPGAGLPINTARIVCKKGTYTAWKTLALPSQVEVFFEEGSLIDPVALSRNLPLVLLRGEQKTVNGFLEDTVLYLDSPLSPMTKEGDAIILSNGSLSESNVIRWIDFQGMTVYLEKPITLPSGAFSVDFLRSGVSFHGAHCTTRQRLNTTLLYLSFAAKCAFESLFFADAPSSISGTGIRIENSQDILIKDVQLHNHYAVDSFFVFYSTGVRFRRCLGYAQYRGLSASNSTIVEQSDCDWKALLSAEKDIEISLPSGAGSIGSVDLDQAKGFNGFDVPLSAMRFQDFGRMHVRRDLLAGVLNNGAYEWMHAYTLSLVQGLHGLSLIPLPYGWVDSLVSDAILDALLSS